MLEARSPGAAFIGACLVTVVLLPDLSGATGYLWAHHLLPIRPVVLTVAGFAILFLLAFWRDFQATGGIGLVEAYRSYGPLISTFGLVVVVRSLWVLHAGSLWVANGYYAGLPAYEYLLFLLLLPVALIPGVARHYRTVVLIPYIIVVATMMIDVLHPGTFSKNDVQPAGLLGNPNFGAALLMGLTIAAIEWRWMETRDWPIWYISAPLVFMTGSRTGILMCLCAGLWWLSLSRRTVCGTPVGFGKLVGLTVGLGIVTIGLSAWTLVDSRAASWVLAKLTSFLHPNVLAHGVRADLLKEYLTVAMQAPLLGHGVDFWMQNRWGPHNTYVLFLISYGLFGLLALVAFFITAFWNFWRVDNRRGMVFVVVILGIQSGFMDLLLDQRFVLFLLALICSAGWAERTWARAASRCSSPMSSPSVGGKTA